MALFRPRLPARETCSCLRKRRIVPVTLEASCTLAFVLLIRARLAELCELLNLQEELSSARESFVRASHMCSVATQMATKLRFGMNYPHRLTPNRPNHAMERTATRRAF